MMATWVLPDSWEWRRLGLIAGDTERRNPGLKPDEYFRYVDIASIDNDKGEIRTGDVQSIIGRSAPSRARKVITEHDILFAATRPYLRNIAVVPKELDSQICSTGFCVIRAHPGMTVPEFVYYACRSSFFIEQLLPKQRGATYPAVSDNDVYDTLLPVPYPDDPARSLETQRHIVARIEALFAELRECRKLHEAVVEDTNRLMDAVLAEVFDTATIHSWPYEAELSDLVEINAPLVDPTLPEYRNLPHINGEVIEQGSGQLLPFRTAAEDKMRSSKYLFKSGSVLYSKIRPRLRKVTTVDFVGLCSADMYPLERKTTDLSNDFLKWALLSPHFTDYAVAESGRARMPKINRPQLFAYRLRYPDRDEQDRIAALLAATQAELAELKKTEGEDGALLDVLEQSILAQAFRGEL